MTKAYLEPNEVQKLEWAATNLRDRLLIRLIFRLGSRVSEALALEVRNVDWEHRTVMIVHLKTRFRLLCPNCQAHLGRSHSFCPGCGTKIEGPLARQQSERKQRILPVDNETLAMLAEYVERGGPVVRDGKQLLFGINRHRAWQVVTACAQRAGLEKLVNPETGRLHNVSPHRLRDAFAVHAMKQDDSGDAQRLLQQHLGHASFNTTARYRKVAGEEQRKWYDRLWKKPEDSGSN